MDGGFRRYAISVTAICWSLIQLYSSTTYLLDILQLEVVHITFAMILVFLLKPGPDLLFPRWLIDYLLALLSLALGVYFLYSYPRIIERIRFVDEVLSTDIVACVLILGLLMEAGRRLMGWGLSLLGLVTITYAFGGYLLPGMLGHASVSLKNFTEFMVLTQEGIFGIPLRVSTTYVFLFVLFGAFLQYGKLGEFYNDLAVSVAGGLKGGPGKVAVVSSSLLGTISGSAVANVTTSGTFTIPMMKRAGYTPVSAGAIEALASTGSQIVPPIMGAAAFIMAELTRIPYWSIAKAAIIPSVLYYVVVYSAVHFEAVRSGLGTMIGQRKPLADILIYRCYMLLPLGVIVYYLASGHSITLSATMAIVTSFSISALPILARRRWKDMGIFVKALEEGAKGSIAVAIPCAIAGVIVGVLTLTGLGLKFTEIILELAGNKVAWMLMITSVICLILGMGMPTSAAYITVAILAIPALIKGGVPLITAHFFGFYFANLSMITPPVALAAYAGAGIARANSSSVGIAACRMGSALYLIPFLLATYPSLMLLGSWQETAYSLLKSAIILVCITSAISGVIFEPLKAYQRSIFVAVGILLWASPHPAFTDLMGVALFTFGIITCRLSRIKSGEKAEAKPAVRENPGRH